MPQILQTMSTVVPRYLPESVEELVECLGLIPHPEGGYFKETFRSGSIPMSTRGCTDTAAPSRDLVPVERQGGVRNCLTSIFWVPTKDSPKLLLSVNRSDHVHYYHGGAPFEYIIYDTASAALTRTILGPDIRNGHVLQLAVPGGCYKCGQLLLSDMHLPYAIIAEAVGPGFDVDDFSWVTTAELQATGQEDVIATMKGYAHPEERKVQTSTAEHFDTFYDAEKSNIDVDH